MTESDFQHKGLNELVGRAVLSKTDGIVGSNTDDLATTQSRETDSSSGVGDEILR